MLCSTMLIDQLPQPPNVAVPTELPGHEKLVPMCSQLRTYFMAIEQYRQYEARSQASGLIGVPQAPVPGSAAPLMPGASAAAALPPPPAPSGQEIGVKRERELSGSSARARTPAMEPPNEAKRQRMSPPERKASPALPPPRPPSAAPRAPTPAQSQSLAAAIAPPSRPPSIVPSVPNGLVRPPSSTGRPMPPLPGMGVQPAPQTAQPFPSTSAASPTAFPATAPLPGQATPSRVAMQPGGFAAAQDAFLRQQQQLAMINATHQRQSSGGAPNAQPAPPLASENALATAKMAQARWAECQALIKSPNFTNMPPQQQAAIHQHSHQSYQLMAQAFALVSQARQLPPGPPPMHPGQGSPAIGPAQTPPATFAPPQQPMVGPGSGSPAMRQAMPPGMMQAGSPHAAALYSQMLAQQAQHHQQQQQQQGASTSFRID